MAGRILHLAGPLHVRLMFPFASAWSFHSLKTNGFHHFILNHQSYFLALFLWQRIHKNIFSANFYVIFNNRFFVHISIPSLVKCM